MKIGSHTRRSSRANKSHAFLEQLESRLLLSGNVTAGVSAGLLSVQGGSNNNSIIVDQSGLAAGQFRVSSGDGTTTINGKSSPQIFSAATGIAINLGSGNDTVVIQNATVANGVALSGAGGNQVFTLNSVTIGGNFTLNNSGGQNSTAVNNSTVKGNITVNAGAGYSGSCGSFWGGSTFSNANQIFNLSASTVANNVAITNTSGETTTDIESSSVGNNLTVTNGANSYGSCSFNSGFCCSKAASSAVGDFFTLNNSSIGNNVTVSNASDGNATNVVNSSITGSLAVSNVVGTASQSCFGYNSSCNLANASDAFALLGSTVVSNVTLANISDGATADIENSTIVGALSINNGVGSYYQGFTACGGQTSSNFGDFLSLNVATIIGNVVITNGSTYNSTDIESSTLVGNVAVSNGLNYSTQSGGPSSCGGGTCGNYGCCGNSCCGNYCGGYSEIVLTTDLFTLNNSTIDANLAVSNASGYTNTTIANSTVDYNMTITNSTGIAYFQMDFSIVGNNLAFSAGAGVTNVSVTNSFIVNNATINVAAGASVVINPSQVINQLSITT